MDPNYVFPDGNRPLHYAASLGLIEVVVWLVKVGVLHGGSWVASSNINCHNIERGKHSHPQRLESNSPRHGSPVQERPRRQILRENIRPCKLVYFIDKLFVLISKNVP